MYFFRLLILALLSFSCGSNSLHKTIRIGIDNKWYPIDFGPQTSYVNGYTEELLLEMSRYSGMSFELIPANWDSLVDGLRNKKYDAILTSMPPYEYNVAKYDFSKNYLDLGPVLILPNDGSQKKLSDLKGNLVGIIVNSQNSLILEKEPSIIIRTYNSPVELLDAVSSGEIQAALLDRLPAINFVTDIYANRLQVVGEPLTHSGLRLVGPKGKIDRFNSTLETLRKKKVVESLLKKWGLA